MSAAVSLCLLSLAQLSHVRLEDTELPVAVKIVRQYLSITSDVEESTLKELIRNRDRAGSLPMHHAAEEGRLDVVQALLELGADVNVRQGDGQTALLMASARGYLDMAEYLLLRAADPQDRDNRGRGPLSAAAAAGNLALVRLLVEFGADVSNMDNDGRTALHVAAERGDGEIVEYLLLKLSEVEGISLYQMAQEGDKELLADFAIVRDLFLRVPDNVNETLRKDIVRKKDGFKLIHFAAEEGQLDAIKALIRLGVDVDVKTNGGRTAVLLATQGGHEDVVRFLLSRNADVKIADKRGNSPIHIATNRGNINIVKALLESGVDPDVGGRAGLTALHIAVRRNNEEMVDLLLSKRADPEARTKWNATPLQFAIHRGSEAVVKTLLDNGAKVGRNSTKILNLAIEKNYLNVVEYLVAFCDCVDGRDESGITPLHTAALSGNKIVTKLLLDAGIKMTKRVKDRDSLWEAPFSLENSKVENTDQLDVLNPLHVGSEYDYLDMYDTEITDGNEVQDETNYFLEVSSTIMITNIDNSTEVHSLAPLHVASIHGLTEIVQMLISYGASLDVRDERGYTPLHYACENNHSDVVRLLMLPAVNKNKIDVDGLTPLHIACKNGLLEVVRLLLSYPSASINVADSYRGLTPLHYAVWNGFIDTVELLIAAGAKQEIQDRNLRSPLFLATATGRDDIVRTLLNAGAYVWAFDITDMIPLHVASREGYPGIVELLLEGNDFQLEWRDENGSTPLHFAVTNTFEPIRRRSNVEMEGDKLENVKIFLSRGDNVNVTDGSDMTPLHIACRDGFSKIVKLLLSHRSNTEAKDKRGWIPLQYAALKGRNNVVQTLLNINTDKVIDESYLESSLLISSEKGHDEVVRTFLEYSVDPDTKDTCDRTPLHLACRGGHTGVVRLLLLTFGATTVDAKDKWGWKPLNYAASWRGHKETVELLLNIKLGRTLHGHFDGDRMLSISHDDGGNTQVRSRS